MNVTTTGALCCPRCQRIRMFWYAGQRAVEHITRGNARGEFMVPRRAVGLFYACTTCGHAQQWGCAG